ncbi:MAG: hypothetical protein V3U58_04460, partial [Thermodesulfobacteriota bacterium]
MYTAISVGVQLNDNLQDGVIDVLKYMTSGAQEFEAARYTDSSTHPLFGGDTRWNVMLRCGSYYFDYQTDFNLIVNTLGYYYLSGVSNLKNYDNEINLFLDWLCPFINTHFIDTAF